MINEAVIYKPQYRPPKGSEKFVESAGFELTVLDFVY